MIIEQDKHYSKAVIEPIEYMCLSFTREEFKGFLKGNILKYSLRAPYKGQEEEDRRKAKWYLDLLYILDRYPLRTLDGCLDIFKADKNLDQGYQGFTLLGYTFRRRQKVAPRGYLKIP